MESNDGPSRDFLSSQRSKTKFNAIEVPSISLTKGGGTIKGIDEKFSVNVVNGTKSFSIPLPFSSASGASPSLSLSYNSGALAASTNIISAYLVIYLYWFRNEYCQ